MHRLFILFAMPFLFKRVKNSNQEKKIIVFNKKKMIMKIKRKKIKK